MECVMPDAHFATHSSAFQTSRWLPIAVVVGLAVLMLSIASYRATGVAIREPDSAAAVVRELRFEDRADGSVAVIDHRTNQKVGAIAGEAGFARGTLRGFARERRLRGVSAEHPLELVGRIDGRLTLSDPQTGRVVDLESFGANNSGVFAQLLAADGRQ
jgi:putative photosynthetic complex assembly protein